MESSEIRNATQSFRAVQDNRDISKVADVQNRLRHCASLLDIIECRKFPALKPNKSGSSNSVISSESRKKPLLGVPFNRLSYLKIDPQCGSDPCYIAKGLVDCVTSIKPPSILLSLKSKSKYKNAYETSDLKSCNSSLSSKGPLLSSLKMKDKGKQQLTLRTPTNLKKSLLNGSTETDSVDNRSLISMGEESNSSVKLCTAFDTIKHASKVLDPSRCYFYAGLLFDDVSMHDRAIQCFKKSIKRSSAEAVVDNYRMKETSVELHKFKTMSYNQQQNYLSERAILRLKLIYEEERRSRLKVLVSHIQLTRLNMILGDYSAAHSSLCSSFEWCESREEHVLTLEYFHALLSEMSSCVGSVEFTHDQTILRESAGPLAEAHIWILQDLLKDNVISHGKKFHFFLYKDVLVS
jgi:hypothetical protein